MPGQARPVSVTDGTPYACRVIVAGPSGTVEAPGTEAPAYPPYRPPTTDPLSPVATLMPAMAISPLLDRRRRFQGQQRLVDRARAGRIGLRGQRVRLRAAGT